VEELKQFKEDLELKKNERITKASEAKERLSTLKLEAQVRFLFKKRKTQLAHNLQTSSM
jgi:hypothetical protein